ncbi:MAG TPA: Flp pilus assembly protein CpaB [Propionibacteriaceae bacterium]|nr:Flp pilus assembly protein CpaB [Propionibacteriaceae bacterium]
MNRRIVAAFVAAALALVAFISIFTYVRNADTRALNGVEAKKVYVVASAVTKGTLGESLGSAVALAEVPAKTVPADAVYDISAIKGKAASVDLVAGEVLLASRFVDPAVASQDTVAVPKGMEQMSLLLKPEQIRGGMVQAGDTIGVVLTLKIKDTAPFNVPGIGNATMDGDFLTKQVLSKVLVTRVQGASTPAAATSGSSGTSPLPTSSLIVTVALNTSDIEKLTWAQSAGTLVLAVENKDTDDSSSQYTSGKVVLR